MSIGVGELRDAIIARPLEAIALAFAIGAVVALDRSGRARRAVLSSLGTAALGTFRHALAGPSSRSWLDLEWPSRV